MNKGPGFRKMYDVVWADVTSKTRHIRRRMESEHSAYRKEEDEARKELHVKMRDRLKTVQVEMDELARGLGLVRINGSHGIEDMLFPYDVYSFSKCSESYDRSRDMDHAVDREVTKAVLKIMKDPDSYAEAVETAVAEVGKEFE